MARYIADHFRTRYHIVSVADGNEALERLKSLEPDLIIADRMLPGLDGLKLCQAVKQNIRTCHIPVVISRYGRESRRADHRHRGRSGQLSADAVVDFAPLGQGSEPAESPLPDASPLFGRYGD